MIRAQVDGKWFIAAPAEQRYDFYGDEPIEETDECKGCMFQRSPASTCVAAGRAAVEAGMPDCESRPDKCRPGFIYLPDPSGGRQLDIIGEKPDLAQEDFAKVPPREPAPRRKPAATSVSRADPRQRKLL